jgi:hypothetical protein
VGEISNIHISNFNVQKSSPDDNTPLINIRSNLHDFYIEHFDRNSELDLNPSAPTVSISDCRPTQVQFEGLTNEHIEEMILSPKVQLEENRLNLTQRATMRLIQGGFRAISIHDPEQKSH